MEPGLTKILEAARALQREFGHGSGAAVARMENARKALDELVQIRLALRVVDQAIEEEFAETKAPQKARH